MVTEENKAGMRFFRVEVVLAQIVSVRFRFVF